MYWNKYIFNVFLGCCACSFLMEVLMMKSPESANLITFLQFFFISLQGFIFTSKCGTVKNKIPLRQYAILVSLFFFTSVLNNFVYTLHVPSTLHMIIRSASSPASMLVYWYAKDRRPSLSNAVGSILITIGVILSTLGGAAKVDQESGHFLLWCIGVTILVSNLLAGALTGLQQEVLYTKYGKHSDELMFYTHALPLPLFMGIGPQLYHTAARLSINIWLLIALNIISQFYCAHSVYALATKENSVTVSFILTLRKFVSLIISTVVFKNYITYLHIFGSVFVILGTVIYFNLFVNRKQQPVSIRNNLTT